MTTPKKPELFIILIIDPVLRGSWCMLTDIAAAAIPEKERAKSIIRMVLRIRVSAKKKIVKVTKASITEICIIFFSLNLEKRKLFINMPTAKDNEYRQSISEPTITGIFRFLK